MKFELKNDDLQKLSIPLEMYDISGQDSITEHACDRYVKNRKQDSAIQEKAKQSPLTDSSAKMTQLDDAPKEKRAELVRLALEDGDPNLRWYASRYIDPMFISETELPELRRLLLARAYAGLEDPKLDTREKSLVLMQKFSEKEIIPVIKIALGKDFETAYAAMRLLDYISDGAKTELSKIISEKVHAGFQNQDIKIQKIASRMVPYALKEDNPNFENIILEKVKSGMQSADPAAQTTAAEMISRAPIGEVASLIKTGLNHANPEVQKAAMTSLYQLRRKAKEEALDIVTIAFDHPNIQVQAAAISALKSMADDPAGPGLQKKACDKIREGLLSTNDRAQEEAMILLEKAGKIALPGASDLFKLALGSKNLEIRKKAVAMVGKAFRNPGARDVINAIIDQGMGDELIKPPLYKENNIAADVFSRQNFDKTGSKLTLVGGSLKEKSVVRQLEAVAFVEWQKLYENYEMWRNVGFDYVPIEPILSYRLNNQGLVDVFSGVLDLSLGDWERKSNLFRSELESQLEKIIEALEHEGIKHGHPHEGNFCLRFFRNRDNTINFQRTPRLYLIDFDQAVSPEN